MDLLQSLAAVVLSTCPTGYDEARLEAEVDENYAEMELLCYNQSGELVRSNLPGLSGPDIHDILDAIRERMAEASGERWTRCVFLVRPDRSFKLDVSY
jgi:hypothetical protein